MLPVLAISIPSPPVRHDELLRARVAPVVRALQPADPPRVVWFERANKPDWGVRVMASGEEAWLEAEVRPALMGALGVATGEARFVEEAPHDKWTGGLALAEQLSDFHRADTLACLDALDSDARGDLGSRAQFSLVAVEGLLDALQIHGDRRLGFYRESFEWAIELGRWHRDVFESLERTFEKQREMLAAAIATGDVEDDSRRWPSADAGRIGREWLAGIVGWARSPAAAPQAIAVHAARGHSNRLGIHGGREAALRYLMWRARGGRALEPA